VLDNAVVEGVGFVAAGTLVPPNKRVRLRADDDGQPRASMVRALTDADRAWIVHSCDAYTRSGRREYLAESG
jgi:carbonic anhydrase/acetyltransferase-like protein (isoleucine patch superfamily)